VLFYDCPYYEFYYGGLRPGEHYLPVNLTSLPAVFRAAEADTLAASWVGGMGLKYAAEHLTTEAVFGYWHALLADYAALQSFNVTLPPDACTCWPVTRRQVRPAHIPRRARRCSRAICDFAD
jgi:hypothetical protein